MQEADISGYIPNGEWDLVGKPSKDVILAAWKTAASFLSWLYKAGIFLCAFQREPLLNPAAFSMIY